MHLCDLVLSPTRELWLQVGRIPIYVFVLGTFMATNDFIPASYIFSDFQRVAQVRLPHPCHFGSLVWRTWKLRRSDQQAQGMSIVSISSKRRHLSIHLCVWCVISRELNAKCCVVRSLVWLLDSSNLIVFSSDFFLARMPHSDYNSWSAAGCDGTGHHRTRGMQPGPWRGRSYARLARHAFRTPDTLGLSSSSRVIFDDLIC